MTSEELRELLGRSGYPSRIHGEEVKLRDCWFCGNERWNLELNANKGVFSCWSCRESGRLDSLLSQLLGTSFHIPVHFSGEKSDATLHAAPDFRRVPIETFASAKTYMERRGLDEFLCRVYGVEICVEPDHLLIDRICFPVREFWTGVRVGYVGRSFTSKKPKYLTDVPKKVIAGYRTRDLSRPCVLVEGFFDGIAVHRAGFQAGILLGIESASIIDFAARLPSSTPLLILLDGEAKKEASSLYWNLLPLRDVSLLQLPESIDPGELHPSVLQAFISRYLPH